MFVPFWLTLLWFFAVAFRAAAGLLQRPWSHWWWAFILGGTLLLIPFMIGRDVGNAPMPKSIFDWAFFAVPVIVPFACWGLVASHVLSIHRLREQAAHSRVADYVTDICLYPVILAILASHACLVYMTTSDVTDAGTTLAASGIFESWALASVLAMFESYTSISIWMKLGAYQFLVLNAGINAAEFFVKGVAPCSLCYRLGSASCMSLASWFEHVKYSHICHRINEPSCALHGWLGYLGIPEPELMQLALGISGTIAVVIVGSLEHERGALLSLSKDGSKKGILPTAWTPRGSFLKLLGVKLIVGVIFFQPYALSFLKLRFPTLDVEMANAWLLTIEALLLHVFHSSLAYPSSDFVPGGPLARNCESHPGGPPASYGGAEVEAQTGAAATGGEPGDDARGPARMTWMEWFIIILLGWFLLLSWISLASMLNLGACKARVPHGSVGGGESLFHTCDAAAVSCDAGYALPSGRGSGSLQATCGQDEQWLMHDSRGRRLSAACSVCALGHVGYPNCTACSSDVHCKGHALSVTDDGLRKGCSCSCDSRWSGADCGACALGHISYPACSACTSADHCNGHAVSVTDNGNRTHCSCTCDSRYSGPDCGACAPGHVLYPQCDACSVSQHCNGHAASVKEDGSRSGCKCTCESRYSGPDCGQCAPGHINYPECTPCTSQEHCHGHAISVTDDGDRSKCVCKCDSRFVGEHCGGYVTEQNCRCKDEWETCSFGIFGCANKHGCNNQTTWRGKPWCRTEDTCPDSWDYC